MRLIGTDDYPSPKRILLLQLRRIGDTLLCTPAIRALAKQFPDAKIDFIAENPCHEVLLGNPRLNRLLISPRGKLSDTIKFIRLLREAKYDWAIDFLTNPRSAQYCFFSGAELRLGLDRFGRRWAYTHKIIESQSDLQSYAVDLRLNILKLLKVNPDGRQMEIYADAAVPAESERVQKLLDNRCGVIAVAVGSHNPAKRYPVDLTAKLIALLQKENLEVVLTAGPGEQEFAEEIQSQLSHKVLRLDNARVPSLAALYRKSALYIGPDSSPKHIAVAVGIPTLTIFGPGCVENWNDPLNPRNLVISARCAVRPNCIESECAEKNCLRKIPPEQILSTALTLLKNLPR